MKRYVVDGTHMYIWSTSYCVAVNISYCKIQHLHALDVETFMGDACCLVTLQEQRQTGSRKRRHVSEKQVGHHAWCSTRVSTTFQLTNCHAAS